MYGRLYLFFTVKLFGGVPNGPHPSHLGTQVHLLSEHSIKDDIITSSLALSEGGEDTTVRFVSMKQITEERKNRSRCL